MRGHHAQKSELRAHQMTRKLRRVPGSLRKKSELSSYEMGSISSIKSNGELAFPPQGRIISDFLRYWIWYVIPPQVHHLGPRSSSQFFYVVGTMVSGRSSVSSRSLLWCISLLGLTVHALLRRMRTFRPGVPLPWPGWWTPVGVSNHGKTYHMYLDHVRPFRLCGSCQGSFPVSCGTVRCAGERITRFWWRFVPCSFHCVASCFPLRFWCLCARWQHCRWESQAKSRTVPGCLVHVCLERQCTGVLSDRDHSSQVRRK